MVAFVWHIKYGVTLNCNSHPLLCPGIFVFKCATYIWGNRVRVAVRQEVLVPAAAVAAADVVDVLSLHRAQADD